MIAAAPADRREGVVNPSLPSCADAIRSHDPDRFFCDLLAPAPACASLFALHAFEIEVARIPERVSEPLLGAIRLQWWREALDGIATGTPRRHEVVLPLAGAVAQDGLALPLLYRMIDGWDATQGRDGPQDLADIERHETATRGVCNLAALGLLGATQDENARTAANEAALAVGLTRLLLHAAGQSGRGRPALPGDVLARHGLDAGSVFDPRRGERLAEAAREIAEAARGHVAAARLAGRSLPRRARPALLPVAFAAADLARLGRLGHDLLDPRLQHRGIARQMRVLGRGLRGTF